MSKTIKITVTEQLYACEVPVCAFTADVEVTVHPAYPDTWEEPGEQAFAEFCDVIQLDGPHILSGPLTTWALTWVACNQATCLQEAFVASIKF